MGIDNKYLGINKGERYHYFFNGDADGICSVLQFIKSGFLIDSFITGPKRDQILLRHGEMLHNSDILVFDIELAKNIQSIKKILDNGCEVTWFDHHGNNEKDIFLEYTKFFPNIDISPNTSTALIVNKFLNNPEMLKWAIVGLFGDNIDHTALQYCKQLQLTKKEISILSQIGKLINYNSYGTNLNDLIIHPITILNQAQYFTDPISFYKETDIIEYLSNSFNTDLELGLSFSNKDNVVFLPNLPWAKRIHGILGNYLIKKYKTKPLAILVDIGEDNYLISVRAPLNQPRGVGDLCRLFAGGGRATAGGINNLHKKHLEKFIQTFLNYWV